MVDSTRSVDSGMRCPGAGRWLGCGMAFSGLTSSGAGFPANGQPPATEDVLWSTTMLPSLRLTGQPDDIVNKLKVLGRE